MQESGLGLELTVPTTAYVMWLRNACRPSFCCRCGCAGRRPGRPPALARAARCSNNILAGSIPWFQVRGCSWAKGAALLPWWLAEWYCAAAAQHGASCTMHRAISPRCVCVSHLHAPLCFVRAASDGHSRRRALRYASRTLEACNKGNLPIKKSAGIELPSVDRALHCLDAARAEAEAQLAAAPSEAAPQVRVGKAPPG